MKKRYRKPATKPDMRQTWLRRYEMDGESPPQIAAKDGYDVRTVRKQIELAKEERERRETRSIVLRNALESHYRDICQYAEELTSMIKGESKSIAATLDPYIEIALKQHLPRSPIWKGLRKRELLQNKMDELENSIKNQLQHELEKDKRIGKIISDGEDQAVNSIIEVLVFQAKAWAQGQRGLNMTDNFKTKSLQNKLVSVQYGFAQMGNIKQHNVNIIREVLHDFESKVKGWDQFEDMMLTQKDLKKINKDLLDEIAIITHKRIVPGKCQYCPV